MVDDAVCAAALQRSQDPAVHRGAHVDGDFMVVQMDENKIQRAILRQGDFIERAVDHADIRHARMLHSVM